MEYGLEHFIDLIGLGLDCSSMLPGGKFSMLYSSYIYLEYHWVSYDVWVSLKNSESVQLLLDVLLSQLQ